MRKVFVAVFILTVVLKVNAQQVTVVNFDTFEPQLHKQTDTLYMVHFWATWCIPCVKEMPTILEETKKFANEKFKLILVSFDFTRDIDSKLEPYLVKHNFNQHVFVMDDPDYNSWINKVDSVWSGALPATFIYNKNTKEFHEGSFKEGELSAILNTKLKNRKQ